MQNHRSMYWLYKRQINTQDSTRASQTHNKPEKIFTFSQAYINSPSSDSAPIQLRDRFLRPPPINLAKKYLLSLFEKTRARAHSLIWRMLIAATRSAHTGSNTLASFLFVFTDVRETQRCVNILTRVRTITTRRVREKLICDVCASAHRKD